MDNVQLAKSPGSNNNGATEVVGLKEGLDDGLALQEVDQKMDLGKGSDGSKGRSSRRKPKKTHRFVDSEDEGDEEEQKMEIEYYGKEGKLHQGLYDDGKLASGSASNIEEYEDEGENDDEEEEEEEEELEEEEDEAEEGHPQLPEGTVVVQPMAVEDFAPAFQGPEFSHGRKTTTDVIPDTVPCTACNHAIPTNSIDNFFRHPELKVLLCRECYALHETKPIRTGDDGLDDACRWCAEGGDLICCDFCHNAFCKLCIQRNLGRQELRSILNAGDSEKWHCYVCDPRLLVSHVESCNMITAAVEEREKVARGRQKSGMSRSPRRSQLMPGKVVQQGSLPDTAALASVIASQVMSANTGRRGGGRTSRGGKTIANSMRMTGTTSKGDVLYIRTPTGGVVGIPAKSMDQMANVPMPSISSEPHAKSRSSRGSRSPRTPASATRQQFTNLPSLPMTSVTLSSSPPNINEYNVWAVLEKLLAATQSMGMLLGSLKDDLRRTGTNVIATEQLKKRREVAMKLWRAFVAYKKSFLDIEIFTRTEMGNQSAGTQLIGNQQGALRGNSLAARTGSGEAAVPKNPGMTAIVVQPDDVGSSEGKKANEQFGDMAGKDVRRKSNKQSKLDKNVLEGSSLKRTSAEQDGSVLKKPRLEVEAAVDEATEESESARLQCQEKAIVDSETLTSKSREEGRKKSTVEEKSDDQGKNSERKGDLFGSLHFEPLFEIKPMMKKE